VFIVDSDTVLGFLCSELFLFASTDSSSETNCLERLVTELTYYLSSEMFELYSLTHCELYSLCTVYVLVPVFACSDFLIISGIFRYPKRGRAWVYLSCKFSKVFKF